MTLSAVINGTRVVVPGVYSSVKVEDNLANVAPGPRNILIIGEAAKGVPGSLLDLSRTFFTDYQSVKNYYGSGPIVDAARMLFSNQASPVFTSSLNSLFVYKTNNSSLATLNITRGLSLYGTIAAAEYGEDGNAISCKVEQAAAEVKPKNVVKLLMTSGAGMIHARVSGGSEQTFTFPSEATVSEMVSIYEASAVGFDVSGGSQKAILVGGETLTLSPDLTHPTKVTLSSSGSLSSVSVGDIVYIPVNSILAGISEQNAGNYEVQSVTSSSIVMDRLTACTLGGERTIQECIAASGVVAGSQTAVASAAIMVFDSVTLEGTATTKEGVAACVEFYAPNGDIWGPSRSLQTGSKSAAVSSAVSLSASISLTMNGTEGSFALSSGSFAVQPKKGDLLVIPSNSVLKGTGSKNVGAWVVTSAGAAVIKAKKSITGTAPSNPVSVSAQVLDGQTMPFYIKANSISTVEGPIVVRSASEKQVRILASRLTDGAQFPQSAVGGRVVLELGYQGTSASVTITKDKKLKTSVSGGSGANLDILMSKYNTIGDLIAFINTKTGYSARVSDARWKSLSPSVLDQVDAAGICSGHSANSFPGLLKSDYFDFKSLIDNNFGLISFVENTAAVSLAGLPDVSSAAKFLEGGAVGATSNVEIQNALDAALKIDVSQVVPLFSRDSDKDIEDGLTDQSSVYSIDSINSAVRAHVQTASSIQYQKERFAVCSIHGSFDVAKQKAAEMSSERIQMTFQQARTINSNGDVAWFLPWMLSCAVAAGRVQAILGTSLLRKSFQVSNIKHVGDLSVFSDVFVPDFDADTKELDQAIEAGLIVLRSVTGFGVRMESPDLSTRSRQNDPKGWYYERVNVQFVVDETVKTLRSTLDNFIGSRTTDVSPSVISKSVQDVLASFVAQGALRQFSVDSIILDGNTYKVTISVFPVEAVEFITVDVLARRATGVTE